MLRWAQARWPSSSSRFSYHRSRWYRTDPHVYDRVLAGNVVLFWLRRQSVEVLVEEELPVVVLAKAQSILTNHERNRVDAHKV